MNKPFALKIPDIEIIELDFEENLTGEEAAEFRPLDSIRFF